MFSFLLGKYLGRELLSHRVDECLTSKKLPNSSSNWLCHLTASSARSVNGMGSHHCQYVVLLVLILASLMGVTQSLPELCPLPFMIILLSVIFYIIFKLISFPLCLVYTYSYSFGTLLKKILAYFFGCLGSSLWPTDFSQIVAHRLSSCCMQD